MLGNVCREAIIKGSAAAAAAAAAKSLQSCPTLCDPRDGRLFCPWDSPGKNTGVGCHFLLQRMRVKNESEVTQLCLTLHNPMGCSLPGSSVHEIFQARVLECVAISFSIQYMNISPKRLYSLASSWRTTVLCYW